VVPGVSSTRKGGALVSGAAFAKSSLRGGAMDGRPGGLSRWTPSGSVKYRAVPSWLA
jgi:hypothetical protein